MEMKALKWATAAGYELVNAACYVLVKEALLRIRSEVPILDGLSLFIFAPVLLNCYALFTLYKGKKIAFYILNWWVILIVPLFAICAAFPGGNYDWKLWLFLYVFFSVSSLRYVYLCRFVFEWDEIARDRNIAILFMYYTLIFCFFSHLILLNIILAYWE